jgi:ATP-binding cassette subfamily B protein
MMLRLRRRKPSAWAFFRDLPRAFPYLRPYWKLVVGSFSLIGGGVLLSLVSPWPLAILVDTVLGNQPLPRLLGSVLGSIDTYQLLVFAVVAGLLVTALENSMGVLENYVNTKLEQRMILDFRSDLFRHAQRLSLTFHDQRQTGALMYQINNQADSIGAVTVSISPLVQSLVTLVGMFVVTYRINATLALLSLTIVPFVYYSAGYYARRIEPRIQEVQNLEGQSLSIIYEAMSMLRVIVAFGREHHEYRRFRTQGEEAVDARVKLTVRQTVFSLAVNTITAAGTALVLGFGAWQVLRKHLTVGELLVVMGYIAAIYQPLEAISATVSTLQQRFISFRKALKLLETDPEIKEAPDAVGIERARGAVSFDGVRFGYQSRAEVLKGISFEVAAGQRVAIVGPTGAGKSTLVSLIPRFYDVGEGRILLDGSDIRQLKLDGLRDQIAMVLQEPLLFSGTIADNIRYGRLEATDEEIVGAAEAAGAHDFITGLPKQYETELGERGAQISGGERQRISVARAFLRNAPILVLDEPTSSIDSKTEALILDALDRLMVGRTSFMIAHRLSTVRHADLIFVLNHGELVERGTHEELLMLGGLYRQLYDAQIGGRSRRAAATRDLLLTRVSENLREPEAVLRTRVQNVLDGVGAANGHADPAEVTAEERP